MKDLVVDSFLSLKEYCEAEGYKGWDPYDGLNSRIFQKTPLKHWDLARLAWIQLFKRNQINLRKIFLVPKEYNSKGIGLFLSGYVNLARLSEKSGIDLDRDEILSSINELAELLDKLKVEGYSGACWGYNFDWQARRLFLFPRNTPTIVATCFCASALFEAFEVTKNERWLEIALSSANFILEDLNRTEHKEGYLFSYSPLEGNNTVFNASLLGSKLLSYCYKYTGNELYAQEAHASALACVNSQHEDGSWVYGMLPVQNWIDSFHTGYNLEALRIYSDFTGDSSFDKNIEKGFRYYMESFFLPNGMPKYYHNKVYPIDIHCPGQLFVTANRLGKYQEFQDICDKVMLWTIDAMQDEKGYFYYQMKKLWSSKIPYMRWSQAFMFNSMTHYLISRE